MTSANLKLVSLGVVLIILAAFFGYSLSSFIKDAGVSSAIVLSVAAILFLSVFALQAFLVKNLWLSSALCIAEVAAMMIPSFKTVKVADIAAAIVVLLLFIAAAWHSQREIKNHLKLDFLTMGRSAINLAATAIILLGTVFYIGTIGFQDVLNSLIQPAQKVIQQILPNILPGVPSSIADQAQKLLLGQLGQLPANIQKVIVAGFGILTFFTIKSAFSLVSWLVAGLSFLIFKLLKTTKFLTVTTEQTERETVQI